MTTLDPTVSTPRVEALRLASVLYATTLFLSALLLFAVQPMFTKMVLPELGGAPTVWSVAMVFFQAALLGGYAYAHLVVRRLPLGLGALVHLGVLAAAAATLPIAIAQVSRRRRPGIAPWLIALFAASIGLPFGPWRRAHRCCRAGSPPAGTCRRATLTFSTPPPISARSRP